LTDKHSVGVEQCRHNCGQGDGFLLFCANSFVWIKDIFMLNPK